MAGDTGAAVNAAQLASKSGALGGASGAVGAAAGYAAIPLSLYNEVSNWKSGATGSDAIAGAETGAAVGSVIPVVGTAVGALLGGAAGAISSLFGNGEKDPENTNFDQATDIYKQYGAAGVDAIPDKYTALAGLFDLRSNQIGGNIPIYKQYGRMGEQQFTTDMTTQLQSALAKGTITKNTSPTTAYNTVVAPWIASFGKGAMSDTNGSMITSLLQGMVGDYLTSGTADWNAVGGTNPFQQPTAAQTALVKPATSKSNTSQKM